MSSSSPEPRPSLVLIADDQEWMSRSIESILQPNGFAVLRAFTGRQCLALAERAEPDAVILNLHWGAEYQHAPSPEQLALARKLTRSANVTAIIGQHVHVVQPIRRINGKIVVFGEGNLVSNQTVACCPAESQDGLIALLTLDVDERGAHVRRARYVPVWVRHPDYVVVPAPADSWQRTVSVVGRRKYLQPVPRRAP